MFYFLFVFIGSVLFTLGLLFLKKPFFSLSRNTLALLNIILNASLDESEKQKMLVRNVGKVLSSLGVFIVLLFVSIGVAFGIVLLYTNVVSIPLNKIDISSFWFYASMILGFVLPFFFMSKHEKKDYSEWSILLHQLILDNYSISRSIFKLDRKFFKRKIKAQDRPFVIVTGLARAGTTALTKLLFQTEQFHSLSYSNMPFLMGVNLWRKIYNPKKSRLKERKHGDRVMFGYNTIEALEEYFFKISLFDEYILENCLIEHQVSSSVYNDYLCYQDLISENNGESTYLAKNNNLLLRVESLREHDPNFKIILLFRNPRDHAFSLLNQHLRFLELQKDEPFILEYMDWLGHHEFGLNHKPFRFDKLELPVNFEKTSINYWVSHWINYYSRVLDMFADRNLFLADYNDFLINPNEFLQSLGTKLGKTLAIPDVKQFIPVDNPLPTINEELEKKSLKIYNKLVENKLRIN